MIHLEHSIVTLMNNKISHNLQGVYLYKNASLGTCDIILIFRYWSQEHFLIDKIFLASNSNELNYCNTMTLKKYQ